MHMNAISKFCVFVGCITLVGFGCSSPKKEMPEPVISIDEVTEQTQPNVPQYETTGPGFTEEEVAAIVPENDPNDSDSDGLSDEEEAALGTDPNKTDTDSDGLSDSEEVNGWNTDPTKSDTDGDGFSDGYEVLSGFDPTGPGELAL